MNEAVVNYHANVTHISRSDVALFAESPRKFEARKVLRTVAAEPETDAMKIGTGTHAINLKDLITLERIHQIPKDVLNADGHKKGKPWTEYEKSHEGLLLLKADEWGFCQRLSDAIDEEIGAMINGPRTLREKEYYWEHERGLMLRCKLDIVCPIPGGMLPEPWDIQHNLILDLKTCNSCNEWAWWKEVKNRRLWLQDAFYSMAVRHQTGLPVRFAFVLVEKDDPPRVRMRELDPDDRIAAHFALINLLDDMSNRYANNDWSESGEGQITTIPRLKDFL